MRKIEFYILGIENDKHAVDYHNKFGNSLIVQKNNKFYFRSHYEVNDEEIIYQYRKLDIDKTLVETVNSIINSSYKEAKNISEENMGAELQKGSVIGGMASILNKYSTYQKDETTIFYLFTDMFVRILMSHYLENGNKQLALTFLKGILWHFGYYLKWTEGMWKDYTTHKTTVENFVKELENKNDKERIPVISNIKKWILENVIIGLNWRW